MPSVAEALRQHADGYLAEFSTRMPIQHKRVLAAITRCRTGELGHLHYECDVCGRDALGRSKLRKPSLSQLPVGQDATLAGQADRPVVAGALLSRHVHGARGAADDRPRQPASLLQSTVRRRQPDDSRAGVGKAVHRHRSDWVLWRAAHLGPRLTVYHPHVHFVVPGGGVSPDGSRWQAGPENFLLPEKAASIVYRAKFRDAMREAGLLEDVQATAPEVWQQPWVVDVEPVGDGRAALKYLAPYVNRVAISNNRIESVDETSVTYRLTPTGSQRAISRPVPATNSSAGFCSTRCRTTFRSCATMASPARTAS